ncbi:RICIN domain-containing protein [Streptomyces sp. NPDC017991]|uniref:RICIN domain-containing protein n=1 Tax=Streptomyces sp. NPDC017991 TaxID=3365026 RepID=UPI003798C4CB
MSDQQQAPGESSARAAASSTPDAEAVAAQLTGAGAGKPQTASTSEGTGAGRAAASEPEAGADTGTDADADADAEKAASGPAEAGKPEAEAEAEAGAGAGAGADGNAPGSTGSSEGEGEAASGNSAQALSAAATREQHEAVATAATGKNTAVSTRSAVGRPRKPVLAGAALAGAILIAVPLLITVTDKDEEKKSVDNTAADTVLNEAGGPAGVFATQTPSPSKTGPEKKKAATKKEKAVAAPPVAEEAAAPAPKPSPSPSEKKKKAATKKAPSTLPAVMTRVLIKNNTNGTCVDVPGFSSGKADGPVTHATCNSNTDDNQLWNVEKRYDKAGPGGAPLFQIRNVMDSMCLDLPGYQGVGGATKVTEFPCNGTTNDNQLWWLDKQSDGRFWIRNAASNNQCLDSYANNDSTRSLIVWPCAPEGQNNHEWIFTRS